MNRTGVLLSGLIMLAGATGVADDHALTLDQAVTEAIDQSPEMARVRAQKEEASWRKFEALGSGFLPKVSIGAHHYFSKEYSQTSINFGGNVLNMPGFYPTNEAMLSATIPIFEGFASSYHNSAADLERSAAAAQAAHTEFQLRQEIRLAFYKALAAGELKSVAEQNVTTLEDHLKQVETKSRGGVATNYDVLRVQVQLNEAKADALDSEDNVEISRRRLTQLLGLDQDARTLSGVLPTPVVDKVKDLKFTEVPKEREDLRAMGLRAEAARKEHQASGAWFVPAIYVAGQYGFYEAQMFDTSVKDTGDWKEAYNVGIFAKWNLFDGGVSLAHEREAAYRHIQAEKTAEAARLQTPVDFEYWKRRYLSNTDHYQSKTFDITRSQESVRLAKEEERAGTRTSTETLDAELDLFRAKAGVVNALVNAAEAKIRLELALGREI